MANVKDIEGIGPVLGDKLEKAGIVTVESLLENGATRSGRANIARETGISESQILDFVNMADLMRVKGVGAEFAELLQAAGVDTIKELRTRNAENLQQKLEEVHAEKGLTRRVPSLDMVRDFIAQAGSTDPSITY
ncbi:MAG: ferredoxin [Bacteroides sp. SM1_62]|nr:MAG: ferredoxin [Bacteroides sp. SM23_62]KPL26372.1 MAG: ferredoxin [Bacteroides sp. SM1_62]